MRVLIVSEYITPAQSIASVRWSKIGKHLAKKGVDVSVITNEKSFSKKNEKAILFTYDDSLEADMGAFTNYYVVKNSFLERIFYTLYNKLRKIHLKRRSRKDLQDSLGTNKREREKFALSIFWYFELTRARLHVKHITKVIEEKRDCFDVLITTYSPIWPHMVGEKIKKNHPDIIWFADYRDPIYAEGNFRNKGAKKFARTITKDADCVLTVSPDGIDQLLLEETQRCEVLTNGFDFKAFPHRNKQECFTIAYTGTIYNGRCDLNPLVEAINFLAEGEKIEASKIKLIYAGQSSSLFQNQVENLNKNISIEDKGLISREEALTLQQNASIVLLMAWNTENYQGALTGKLFEYLFSNTPIVALISGSVPGSTIKRLISTTETGFTFEEASGREGLNELSEYIYEKYLEWVELGTTTISPNEEALKKYTHASIADELLTLLEEYM